MLKYDLMEYQGELGAILKEYSEQVATANDRVQPRLIENIIELIKIFSVNEINKLAFRDDYVFQKLLHYIKGIEAAEFGESLKKLVGLYGYECVKDKILCNGELFKAELRSIRGTWNMLSHPKVGIMLDIDGTITPLEQMLDFLFQILQDGIIVAFNSGRPYKNIKKIIINNLQKHTGSDESSKWHNHILIYGSNSSEAFRGDGYELYKKILFDEDDLGPVRQSASHFGIQIVDERPNRLVLQAGSSKARDYGWLLYEIKRYIKSVNANYSVSICKMPNMDDDNLYFDIVSANKRIGLDHFCSYISGLTGKVVTGRDIFIAADDSLGNDEEILNIDGAYQINDLGLNKVKALLTNTKLVAYS